MRLTLILFLAWIGVSAFVFGLVMMSNPGNTFLGLPVYLLGPTPFGSYIIPGVILAVVVGGINITALFFSFGKGAGRYNWAIAAGVIICGWIVGQMVIIEAANWLHFLYLGAGLLVILMAWQLKGKLHA